MTKEEVIEMARQAGLRVGPSRDGPDDVWGVGSNLERFAKLVAAAEREACAKVCEDALAESQRINAELVKSLNALYLTCDWNTDDGLEAAQKASVLIDQNKENKHEA